MTAHHDSQQLQHKIVRYFRKAFMILGVNIPDGNLDQDWSEKKKSLYHRSKLDIVPK